MKKIPFLTYLIALLSLASCNGMTQNNVSKAIQKTDSCQLDAKNKYEVYIPGGVAKTDKLPLLVIIDSHGEGKFALQKFKLSADKYPAIIVASDYVKNGFEGYDGAIQTLIDDVSKKYPVDGKVFLTGFSGGARMALGYGVNHSVNGLILCGALGNAQQISSMVCPVFSISGMDDFNFVETAQFIFNQETMPLNLKIELINLTHSWPDSVTLARAFGFLQLSNGSNFSQKTVEEYDKQQLAHIDSLVQTGNAIEAALVARNLSGTTPFNQNKAFQEKYSIITTGDKYKNQLQHLTDNLQFEMKVRDSYLEAFQSQNTDWWKNEINNLDKTIAAEKDNFNKDTYIRIKAFLGIVCFSYGKQFVKQHDETDLKKVLFIYKSLEPENSDMYYYSAFPYYWKGDTENTVKMLKQAVNKGFSDQNQLTTDFPISISSKVY